MQVKRPVLVTAIVTEGLKQEYHREIDESVQRVNESQQELESQSRRYMLQLPSAEMANTFRRQVEEETRKHESARKELADRKDTVKKLVLGERVTYMQIEGYVELKEGDNLVDKMSRAEIVIQDGIILEIRDGTGSATGGILIEPG